MTALEIARRMAELGETAEACRAYTLALDAGPEPADALEAALFLLEHGDDYKIPYTCLVRLYNDGLLRGDILPVLVGAFYEPNVRDNRDRYERNCRLLASYPYIFRRDFLPFEELPLCFFPFDDDHGYVPYAPRADRFLPYVNVRDTVVGRNFFKDLSKPVLASEVYSQYELEYLRDNVRPSEYVGRENHVYLHYADWAAFCAWLQVLSLEPLLEGEKLVFLIGDELEQYPIDFKERFGIDYAAYPLKPVGIREIRRMIWHTQLSSHNGGDFFNEIFDWHPNLLNLSSQLFEDIEGFIAEARAGLAAAKDASDAARIFGTWPRHVAEELYSLRDPTDKDILAAIYLGQQNWNGGLDPAARIAPAIFFQPHFHSMEFALRVDGRGDAELSAGRVEEIHASPIFRGFKYIKTFTPLRRFTTSYGGTVRFMIRTARRQWATDPNAHERYIVNDAVSDRVLNRSFLRDVEDRLYRDSVIVRFEDAKLNPKAVFTALAAFLDLPYTESMTYCSERGRRDPYRELGDENYAAGFSPTAVYATYDEYATDDERRYIEFFLRDAYEYYGYDFHYYDGGPVDMERVKGWIAGFTSIDGMMRQGIAEAYRGWVEVNVAPEDGTEATPEELEAARALAVEELIRRRADELMAQCNERRLRSAEILLRGPRFVNGRGQPLRMTPLLELDPALLEAPLYH